MIDDKNNILSIVVRNKRVIRVPTGYCLLRTLRISMHLLDALLRVNYPEDMTLHTPMMNHHPKFLSQQ